MTTEKSNFFENSRVHLSRVIQSRQPRLARELDIGFDKKIIKKKNELLSLYEIGNLTFIKLASKF